MGKIAIYPNISSIVHQYEGFILDQWGVLHNGSFPLKGALECVKKLHHEGKKLIILSNSAKRQEYTLKRLKEMNFQPEMFLGAITSGEETYKMLKKNFYGKNYLWLTNNEQKTYTSGLNLNLTEVDKADFILAHGVGDIVYGHDPSMCIQTDYTISGDPSAYEPILQRAVSLNIPMICANPDLISINQDNLVRYQIGGIAKRFNEMGGKVTYFGKPHQHHFQACLDLLNLHPSKVVHVGDSLHHDVQGAIQAGIDSVFIPTGVHKDALELDLTKNIDVTTLDPILVKKLVDATGFTPTCVIPWFNY